jgi:hypothetical protein
MLCSSADPDTGGFGEGSEIGHFFFCFIYFLIIFFIIVVLWVHCDTYQSSYNIS